MYYNNTLLTPTSIEHWCSHIYSLEVYHNKKGNIILDLEEMGVSIVRYELTPKMRDEFVKMLMRP